MMKTTLKQAFEAFRTEVMPTVVQRYGEHDHIALCEAWNNYTDSLCKDGELTDLQYYYCPAYGEEMPDDDFAFLLESMKVGLSSEWIPERTTGKWDPCDNHWHCTVTRGTRSLAFEYSMGTALDGEPDLPDVIYCLITEHMMVACTSCYEDFAEETGFDPDSRSGEAVYNEVRWISHALQKMFSEDEIKQLADLMEG